jgi:uncharacterized Zn finger protein
MIAIPSLLEQDIRQRTGGQSFERGLEYFRSGAVFDARRQGMTLKARCEGSRAEAYRVRVTFDTKGVTSAECSCPVGDDGGCKHIAALLLTWREKPEDFLAVEELDAALEQRSQTELVALVKQMVRQRPELETLLEAPLPTPGKRRVAVRRDTYRRQAAAVFRRGGYDWRAESGIADELSAIAEIGNGFVVQENYASAAAVYSEVSAEVLENYEMFHDEEGELAGVVYDSVAGLGYCLAGEHEDTATRATVLEALFAAYRFDLESGGIGLADEVPGLILEHATPAEQRTVACWVQEALPQGTESTEGWRRQTYGGFLLSLEADTLDDEAYLRLCRETGRTDDLVDRLLALQRLDQATSAAAGAGDYELLGLADIFVQHEHGGVAERLMLERRKTTTDTRILVWLKNHYQRLGKPIAACELAEGILRLSPSLDAYKEVRQLAGALGHWTGLRPALLDFVRDRQRSDLLIRIHLDEGEIDAALETLGSRPSPAYDYSGQHLSLEVAEAAEDTRPEAARAIYQQQAERLIVHRGRNNYRDACHMLAKARGLYERAGESEAWATYIAALRERTRNLRALKEELTSAKL